MSALLPLFCFSEQGIRVKCNGKFSVAKLPKTIAHPSGQSLVTQVWCPIESRPSDFRPEDSRQNVSEPGGRRRRDEKADFLSDKTNESRIGKKSSNRQLIIWIELFVPFAFSMLQILMIAAAESGEEKREERQFPGIDWRRRVCKKIVL